MTQCLRKQFTTLSTITCLLVMVFGVVVTIAQAAVSPTNIVTYQGRVLDSNGTPVANASLNMKFFLYDSLVGGVCLWSNSSANCNGNTPGSATNRVVALTDGLFTQNLGDTGDTFAAIPGTVFADDASVYMEVIIAGETLTPRKLMTAVPYALNAQSLDGIDSTGFLSADGDTATGIFDYTGATLSGGSPFVFEGATADAFETTLTFTDPTADRTITFQNATGTVAFLSDIGSGELSEVGLFGIYEDDAAVIVGADAGFSSANGGIGDLKVASELEVDGAVYLETTLAVTGISTFGALATIAGSADGTDALVLTLGDILVTNGDLDLSGGDFNVQLDSGDGASISTTTASSVDALTITSIVPATTDSIDGLFVTNTVTDSNLPASARFLLTNTDNATASDTVYGLYVEVDDNSTLTDDTAYGLYINNPDSGGLDADLTQDAFIYLNNADDSAAITMDDAMIVASAGSVITDGLDVSDSDIVNALNVGANNIIGTDGVIDFTDFDVIAEGFMTMAPDSAGDSITITSAPGDSQIMVVDAQADSTSALGLFDIAVDTVTDEASVFNVDFQVSDAAASSQYYAYRTDVTVDSDAAQNPETYGYYLGLSVNDSLAATYGFAAIQQDAGERVTAGMLIDNLDLDDEMTDGILIRSATGTIVDGIDASDPELENALNVGANNIIGTDGVIDFTDFDVIAEGFMTMAPDSAGDSITITSAPGDSQIMVVDAQADSTSALGLFDIAVDTVTDEASVFNVDFQVSDAAASSQYYAYRTDVTVDSDAAQNPETYGYYLGLSVNDSLAATYGFAAIQQDAGERVTAGMLIDNLDLDDEMTDGILIRSATGTIVDGIDASDPELENALNVGSNTITGTAAWIDFSEFDVSGTTGAITINDNGDAGAISIEGSILDINSLDFVGAGAVTGSGLVSLSSTAASVTLAAQDIANANDDNIVLSSGNLAPDAGENGNDVAIEAEGDILFEATGDIDFDSAANFALTTTGDILFEPGDDMAINFAADGMLRLDAQSVSNTTTVGVLNMDVITVTADNIGFSMNYQVGDADASSSYYANRTDVTIDNDAVHLPTVYGGYFGMNVNDAFSTGYGLAAIQEEATESLTAGMLLENLDDDDSMLNGLLVRSDAGGIVDGIDVSDNEITNAMSVGANNIIGTTASIDFTNFDVEADGSISTAADLTVEGVFSLGTAATLSVTATPDISAASVFSMAGGATNVTDFLGGVTGQIFIIRHTGGLIFECDVDGNLNCGLTDMIVAGGDTTMWYYNGATYSLLSWVNEPSTQTGTDLAEWFPATQNLQAGDVVTASFTEPVHVSKSSSGYQKGLTGIVATQPGLILGERGSSTFAAQVALAGRVPVKFSNENGEVKVGDYLTSSATKPGYAMKATQAGPVIGMVMGDSNGAALVTVHVNNSWRIPTELNQSGASTISTQNVVITQMDVATQDTKTFSSFGLAMRGSAWNGAEAQTVQMMLENQVMDVDQYRLSIRNNANSEVAYITNKGTMSLAGDLIVAGNIYPSDRGTAQTSKYIYYDGSEGAGGDFMRTNASGWGTGSYDFAEMFPSNEVLRAGQVVVFSGNAERVRRATASDTGAFAGIVSTRPGFLAGNNVANQYPIALAGRVPTFVTNERGAISVGDPLSASSTSGFAAKATKAGPIVGYALEAYNGELDNQILVFVNVGYWGGNHPGSTPGTFNTASGFGQGLNQNITSLNMTGNSYLTGNEILDVGRIAGLLDRWSIELDGTIKTEGLLTTILKTQTGDSIQTIAVTSPEASITLTGTSVLESDELEVNFKQLDPSFSNVISATAPLRVIVTPNGPVSLYVSEKDNEHFVVKRFGGDGSAVQFDWMIIGYRNGFEPPEVLPSESASQASPEQNLVDAPVPDEGGTIAEPPSEPVIEQPSSPQPDATTTEAQVDEPTADEVVVGEPAVEPVVVE